MSVHALCLWVAVPDHWQVACTAYSRWSPCHLFVCQSGSSKVPANLDVSWESSGKKSFAGLGSWKHALMNLKNHQATEMALSNAAPSSYSFLLPLSIFVPPPPKPSYLPASFTHFFCCSPLLPLSGFYLTSRTFRVLNFHTFKFSRPRQRKVPFHYMGHIFFKVIVAARQARLGLCANART